MTLEEVQAAIIAYRASATEEELVDLGIMLVEEGKLIDEQLEEIEEQRESALEEAERRREEEEEAALADAERLAGTRRHKTSNAYLTVNGFRDSHCDVIVVTTPDHPAGQQLSAVATERTHMQEDETDWYIWTTQGQIENVFDEAVKLLSDQFNAGR